MSLAAVARLVLAALTLAACTTTPPNPTAAVPTSPATIAPASGAPTAPAPSILPSASPGFAFDPESIVGYYQTLGFACSEPQPSAQAAGYLYRSCVLTDPAGRTLTIGLVTDPADNVADAFMQIRGADSEPVLEPSAVLEPFAAFLGAVLGEAYGTEVLPWLAAHLGDADARTTLGELVIATYTDSPDDHSTLAVEIANQAYLQAPRPSAQSGMANIDVGCVTATDGWLCQVTIAEGGSEGRHSVTLTRADFQRLASSGGTPDDLVRRSLEFLLAREPVSSILRSFALTDIGKYFPEYEGEISKQ